MVPSLSAAVAASAIEAGAVMVAPAEGAVSATVGGAFDGAVAGVSATLSNVAVARPPLT
jgi:hypothetical protein